ncbi:hypothetical protein PGT21_008909 [Puccinia graminis f. sp. tritici]|uniref:Uncharacterized protein n=1 Tax=Puccinia graminis f. sp. tritici TaxID=56615 RepID=A0A5B0LYB1_PUCGR|nr:hypothetical protein PGT21_008909 [Puccinia graminis f. sp. tritici]
MPHALLAAKYLSIACLSYLARQHRDDKNDSEYGNRTRLYREPIRTSRDPAKI